MIRKTAAEIFEDIKSDSDFEARAQKMAEYIQYDKDFDKLIQLSYASDLSFKEAYEGAEFGPKTNIVPSLAFITFREFLRATNVLHDGIPCPPARPGLKRFKLEQQIAEMHADEAAICLNAITHSDLLVEINSAVAKRAYEILGRDTSVFRLSHHSE